MLIVLLLEQLGADLEVSPILLFPLPQNDVVTCIAGYFRLVEETTHNSDAFGWQIGFVRDCTESISLGSSLPESDLYPEPSLFPGAGTGAMMDFVTRYTGLYRILSESLDTVDPTERILTYSRALSEDPTSSETLLRQMTQYRSPSDTLTSSHDALVILSNKPRSLVEALVTVDQITSEQLLQAIMGYIWVDSTGNVIADLPDWGYVLVEDPVAGNTMNHTAIPLTTLDVTRQK